jgi:hemerythrin-like domain-containing protein
MTALPIFTEKYNASEMKIINKDTGKRVGVADEDVKSHKKKLKEEDPILRNADKDANLEELSAMDPPSAYDEDRMVGSNYDQMNPFIQELMDEHKEVIERTKEFDEALMKFRDSGYMFSKEVDDAFNSFFIFFDEHIQPHNRKEERNYFRILHERLIESGEHGTGENPSTAIDLMEDDHTKFIQLAALAFNLLGLGSRLRDRDSQGITFDLAFNAGRELTELLRLHIFREDETLFPISQELLTEEDFRVINEL